MGLPEVRVEAGFPAELLAVRGDRIAGVLSLAYSRIVIHRGRVVARTSAVREYCDSAVGGGAGPAAAGRVRSAGRLKRSPWQVRGGPGVRRPRPRSYGRRHAHCHRWWTRSDRAAAGAAARRARARGRGHHPRPGTGRRPAGGRRRTGAAATWSRPRSRRWPRILQGADAAVFAAGAGPGSGVGPQGHGGPGRGGAVRRRGGTGRRTALPDGLVDGRGPRTTRATRSSTSTCGPRARPTTYVTRPGRPGLDDPAPRLADRRRRHGPGPPGGAHGPRPGPARRRGGGAGRAGGDPGDGGPDPGADQRLDPGLGGREGRGGQLTGDGRFRTRR